MRTIILTTLYVAECSRNCRWKCGCSTPCRWEPIAARMKCAHALWWARWRASGAASPPCKTCSGFLRSPTNRPTSSSRRIARPGFASYSPRWSGIFPQSRWSVTRTTFRPRSRRCWATSRARFASSSITSSINSSAIRPAGLCTGRLRRSRRSAARRKCCKGAPNLPTNMILPCIPTSTRHAVRPSSRVNYSRTIRAR